MGDGWVRPERREDRIEVWDETDEWEGDGQFSGSFGVGADWFLRPRFALVSDLAFRVLPGGPEVNDYARIVHDRYDTSIAELHWGPAFGLDLTETLRVFTRRAPIFFGLGIRYGFARRRARGTLVDVDFDGDGDAAGPEGELRIVTGGWTLGAGLELGAYIRRTTFALRAFSGVPVIDAEATVSFAFWDR